MNFRGLMTCLHRLFTFFAVFLLTLQAGAWGRRGHATIAEVAGYVTSQFAESLMTKEKSFDLGFYANVPDLVWKKSHYDGERPHHAFNYEVFERVFLKHEGRVSDEFFIKDHAEFVRKYPETALSGGRAVWRVQELYTKLTEITAQLRKSGNEVDKQHELQGQWLLLAGTLAHYVGDLAMPLHCTENYDGQFTGQSGLHSFFEDVLVDELFPSLAPDVLRDALKNFPSYHQANAKRDVFALSLELCRDSLTTSKRLLETDKKIGRKNLAKAKKSHTPMIRERMVKATLLLAEIWQRELGWKYNGTRFFNFYGEPEWIVTGETSPSQKNASAH